MQIDVAYVYVAKTCGASSIESSGGGRWATCLFLSFFLDTKHETTYLSEIFKSSDKCGASSIGSSDRGRWATCLFLLLDT